MLMVHLNDLWLLHILSVYISCREPPAPDHQRAWLLPPPRPIQASPAALEAPISHGSLTDPSKDQSCKAKCVNGMKLVAWKNTLHASRDHSRVLFPQSFRFISPSSCLYIIMWSKPLIWSVLLLRKWKIVLVDPYWSSAALFLFLTRNFLMCFYKCFSHHIRMPSRALIKSEMYYSLIT